MTDEINLDERNRLVRIIHKPALQYYIGDGIAGLISAILVGAIIIWFMIGNDVPFWGAVVSIIALFGLVEARRQHGRLNAFFEFYEMDMKKEGEQDASSNHYQPPCSDDLP